MFTIRSQHSRDRVGRVKKKVVNDIGLGIVVTQTPKFDPVKMEARRKYWYDLYYNQIVNNLVQQYRDAGFAGLSETPKIGRMIVDPTSFVTSKLGPTGKMLAPLISPVSMIMDTVTPILAKIPVIGKVFSSVFGGGKPDIPWDEIAAQARAIAGPAAIKTANEEEEYRIALEMQQQRQDQIRATEQTSREGSTYQLPKGITGIKRGALVMEVGKPVEVRK